MEHDGNASAHDVQKRLRELVRSNLDSVRQHFLEKEKLLSGDGLESVASDYAYPRAPIIISEQVCDQTLSQLRKLVDLMSEIPRIFFNNDRRRLHEFYGVPERYARVMCDPGRAEVARFARPDGVMVDGVLKVVETNIDTGIGGVFEADLLCQMHRDSPALRQLCKVQEIVEHSPLEAFIRFFLREGGSWAFWDIDDRRQEQFLVDMAVAMVDRITEAGASVCFATSQEIDSCNGLIKAGNVEVQRLYRGFAATHLSRCFDEIVGVVERVSRFHEAVEGPFSGVFVESKINMALVSDPLNHHLLTEEQARLVEKIIPWTRRVSPGVAVLPSGERDELIGYLESRQDHLVIKHSHSFRGYDVLIGKETSVNEWRSTIRKAIEDEHWIAQEYLESDQVVLPYLVGGQLVELAPRMTYAFFLIGDELGGGGARTSLPDGPLKLTEPELNCGIVPVFSCADPQMIAVPH